jgi:hypothetical protein
MARVQAGITPPSCENFYKRKIPVFPVSSFICAVRPFDAWPRLVLTNMKLTGAHVGFAGAVWIDRPHLQVLAPVLPLFYHSTDTIMQQRAARYFGASKRAILALKDYTDIEDLGDQLNPAFPYPTQYTSIDRSKVQFKYLSLVKEDKPIFYDRTICIKFVRRYSQEAHVKCASAGFVPALLGFNEIGADGS